MDAVDAASRPAAVRGSGEPGLTSEGADLGAHTPFQIEHFIVGPQPTPWGRRRQAARELQGRVEEAAQVRRRLAVLEAEIGCFEALRRQAEAELPPDWRDRGPELERQFWIEETLSLAFIDLLSQGHLSAPTLRLLCRVPEDMGAEIMGRIRSGDWPSVQMKAVWQQRAREQAAQIVPVGRFNGLPGR